MIPDDGLSAAFPKSGPTGNTLATRGCGKQQVTLWDAEKGEAVWGEESFYPHPSFSHDGKTLLVTNASVGMVWRDGQSGKKLRERQPDTGGATSSSDATWSPTGADVLILEDWGNPKIWSGVAGNANFPLKTRVDPTSEVAWHPDGTQVVLVSGTGVVQALTARGKSKWSLKLESDAPGTPHFGKTGTLIVESDGLLVRITSGGQVGATLAATGAAQPRFSPDGNRLAWVQDEKRVMVADLGKNTSAEMLAAGDKNLRLVWADSERLVVQDDNQARIYDVSRGKPAVPKISSPRHGQAVVSQNHRWMAIGGPDLKLVSLKDGSHATLRLARTPGDLKVSAGAAETSKLLNQP